MRVRKVDAPKDQMDKEWDEFQKAMRQVNTISEAIVAEEDEEGRLDRQIRGDRWADWVLPSVEKLRNRQDEIKSQSKEVLTKRTAEKGRGECWQRWRGGTTGFIVSGLESEGSFVIGFAETHDFVLLCRKCCLSTVPFTPCLETW